MRKFGSISLEWWELNAQLTEVASFGISTGELTTPEDVVYFFTKPWKYQDLYERYVEMERNART